MLSHLSRSKLLRRFAGATCVAVSGAAGALIAQQPEPLPPAAPVTAPITPAPVAEPPKPVAVPRKPVAVAEVTLARTVLAAIDADPVLKDVNLIVSVVDRGAVVGGPVTSEEVKKRVEVVIRGVPGVESVKNVCFVQTDADPLLRAMAERLKPDAKPAAPPTLPGVALAPSAPEGFLPPVRNEPPSDLLAGTKPNTVVALNPQLPPVSVLGAPVAPAGVSTVAKVAPLPPLPPVTPPTPALPTAPGALTGSAPAPAKPVDLQAAALAVRKSDPRFARFTVELKPDGALFISGRSASTADVGDFATELRKIPGAGRIVVDPALVR
jgi:hypothetical protein